MSSWCVDFPLLSSWEKPITAESSPPFWNRRISGKLLLGRRRVSQRGAEALCFGQAKYYAVVMCLFRISESASSGYRTFQLVMQGTNQLCLLSDENYSPLTTSAGLPKSNSSWPTRCGISCITPYANEQWHSLSRGPNVLPTQLQWDCCTLSKESRFGFWSILTEPYL